MKKNKCLIMIMFLLIFTLASCKPNDNNDDNEDDKKEEIDRPIRPHEHTYGEWTTVVDADLFTVGEKTRKCDSCELVESEKVYYLDEVSFESKTYQYSGEEKKLLISGLLPKGIRVEYKNNTRTSVGSTKATASYIDESGEVIRTDEATLSIIEYTGFPRVDIDTSGVPILNKEDYVASKITVSNCDEKYQLQNVFAGVKLRGNGTLQAEKKPYRIKFDKKQIMLGLNDDLKAKSWVLLADYYDYSMMRNLSAFYLGDSLLDKAGYYTSSYQHVNLYINGIYSGVYLLAEQQQAGESRVEINEPDSDNLEVNVGYLLELDSYAVNEGDYFILNTNGYSVKDCDGNLVNLPSMSYAIKSNYFSDNQKEFIGKYVNNVFQIMHKAIIDNEYYGLDSDYNLVKSTYTNSFDTINNVINLDSLFRTYIIQEIMKNIDIGFSSFYMYVDFSDDSKYPRLTFGAPWDFDWSSGNVNNAECYSSTGKYANNNLTHKNPWLLTISNADFFDKMIKDYFDIFVSSGVMEGLIYHIDEEATTYKDDFSKNFAKWPTLGTQQHVYATGDVLSFKSHSDAKDFLKNWLNSRFNYLKTIWSEGE